MADECMRQLQCIMRKVERDAEVRRHQAAQPQSRVNWEQNALYAVGEQIKELETELARIQDARQRTGTMTAEFARLYEKIISSSQL